MGIFDGFKKYIATDVEKVKDPVCGIDVVINENLSLEFEGKTFYFCSVDCKERFAKNPTEFLGH